MASEHDVDCERVLTEGGFIFIDCLCSLRRAKAEAWDEGFAEGAHGNPYAFDNPAMTNPYRRG